MTLSIGRLSAALSIEENTLRGWISLAESTYELGHRVGGRRVFDFADAYALGLLSGLSHCGVRVSPSIIADVLAHVVKDGVITQPKPGETLDIRYSDSASITLFLDKASDLVSEKLNFGVAA